MKTQQSRVRPVLAIVAAGVGALLFASCYFNTTASTGSIRLTLAAPIRSIAGVSTQPSQSTARIYLLEKNPADGSTSPVILSGGTDYVEAALSGSATTLTIDGLPAGPPFVLVLTLGGTYNGTYVPASYTVSTSEFRIVAGGTTSVSVSTPVSVPFSAAKDLVGTSLNGVANVGATIYASSSSSLWSGSSLSSLATVSGLPAGVKIQSLSVGLASDAATAQLWLNTNQAIIPYDDSTSTFDTTFSSGKVNGGSKSASSTITVTDSGAFAYNGTDRAVFFQRKGGLGGVPALSSQTSDQWDWLDVDLSQFGGSHEPVNSFVISNSKAYFATKLGAFETDDTLLSGSSLDIDTLLGSSAVAFFSVPGSGGRNIPITSIAEDGSTTPRTLYLGTEAGVYRASETYDTSVIGTPKLATGTNGYPITKLAASPSGTYRVYVTSDGLFLGSDAFSGPKFVPFGAAVLGENVTAMTVNDSGIAYIATDTGLVSIDISSLASNLPQVP